MFKRGNHVRLEIIPAETELLLVASLCHFVLVRLTINFKEVLNISKWLSSAYTEMSLNDTPEPWIF